MTRTDAIARAQEMLRSGEFLEELGRRIAYQTESQNPEKHAALRAYLTDGLKPAFAKLDFSTRLIESPTGKGPYLLTEYHENSSAPTVLIYGHGDVVDGMAGEWRDNLDPWRTTRIGNRVYGRGTADNKGQHSINMAALRAVRETRGGRLGFNVKFLIETGEEIGSPDLPDVCRQLREELKADLLLASDGPRLSAERATLFLGCRGGIRIHLDVNLREGSHHSGNWGGVLANPATILASAIASLVDSRGRLQLDALKPPRLSNQVRAALADIQIEPMADEPALAENWGEDGLSAAERLYAWNTLEVLAMSSGNIEKPANAIPGRASAVLQLRFVVGTRVDNIAEMIRTHLVGRGFPMVEVSVAQRFAASRTDFDSPWIEWTVQSIRRTTGKSPAVLPNFGGSLPNDVFTDILKLPTMWVPHSYPGCSQHAPDEHILLSVTEEALGIMAGLFWDLGEMKRPLYGSACRLLPLKGGLRAPDVQTINRGKKQGQDVPSSAGSHQLWTELGRISMKRTLIAGAAFAVAFSACPASAQELTGTLKNVKDTGAITLGYRDSSIPFSYLDDNQKPIGYAMDICFKIVDAVKKELKLDKLEVKLNPVTSATRIPLLANGTIDLECGSTTNNAERQKQVWFTNTHFLTASRFVSKKANNIGSIDGLKGKSVVSTSGTTNIKQLNEANAARNLGINIIPAKDHAEAFLMVETDRAVAFVMDDILLASLVAGSKEPGAYVISTDAFSKPEPYGIMLRKDDTAFKKVVDAATAALYQGGEAEKIYNKWFMQKVPPKGLNLNVPLGPELKHEFAKPSDSPDPDSYKTM